MSARVFNGNYEDNLERIGLKSIDLLFLDPPYNLNKSFGSLKVRKVSVETYTSYIERLLEHLVPLLKITATVYICGDWKSSVSIHQAASKYLIVRNRITWEREKGRGAKTNWKNSSEDIWFCTVSNKYTFNVEAIKLRKRVIAPYKVNGIPKDWIETKNGNFRDTFPSNIWTDITVPFWAMKENTHHPTQKSEKLLAKLILASTNEGDLVLDPFLGSGTTCVVAEKLCRRSIGIEINPEYVELANHRLETAANNKRIQGYDGIFYERNTKAINVQS